MNRDIVNLKGQIDLAALVEREIGPAAKQNGRWWWWACPFHPDKTPSFGVTPDNGRFKCYGCGAGGDHLDWLQRRLGLSVKESIRELERLAGLPDMPRPSAPVAGVGGDAQPSAKWQKAARAFAAYARPFLWEEAGRPGLVYLRAGGLVDETIEVLGLGWCPVWLKRDPERWGLDGPPVWLARGVVIPCEVAGVAWYVKIRRFDDGGQVITEAGKKYSAPRKDPQASGGGLYGADCLRGDGRPLLLLEGERDAMLAWQELRELVDVASLGGAGKRRLGRWRLWLQPYRQILVAYDADGSGRRGAAYWKALSERVTVIRVPHGGDLAGFYAAGGDLRLWLAGHLGSA